MKVHKSARLLPDMSETEFQELCRDIEALGLQMPIALLDGQIIDGRHRYKACRKAIGR